MFLSTLLDAQADKKRLVFDCSGSQETNRRVLAAEKVSFSGRPGGVPVHFSSGAVSEITFEGGQGLRCRPARVRCVRLQRREYFRIETPRVNPLTLFARMPDGQLLKLAAHDISVSGIGLDAPELPAGIEIGMELPNCHFALPGEVGSCSSAATVRNYFQFTEPQRCLFSGASDCTSTTCRSATKTASSVTSPRSSAAGTNWPDGITASLRDAWLAQQMSQRWISTVTCTISLWMPSASRICSGVSAASWVSRLMAQA